MIASETASLAGPVALDLRRVAPAEAAVQPDPAKLTIEVDQGDRANWDRVASEFADVSYDQTSAFADAKWGGDRTSTLVLRENGRAIGCARLVILRPPILSAGLAYVKFGPLWRPLHQPADPRRFVRVLAALCDEYCRRRGHLLTVLPRPSPEHNSLEQDILREAGFRPRASLVDPTRYLVDVGLAPKAQMASLGQKWRYNLKKAMKAGLSVELSDPAQGIDEFADMHRAMVARKRFADRDAVEQRLRAMGAGLPPSLRPAFAFARKDGRAVAGAVVGRTGEVPIYLFGASRDEALDLNAGYLLQWWIVNWLHEQGERWYDLGGGAMEPSLEQFKRGLVGKAGSLLRMSGEYDFWAGPSGRLAGEMIYRAREVQRMLRAALGRR